MRRRCWMIVLVGMMSYFNPERALGAPQREVSSSSSGSLSPPPYAIILISCSGLVSFVLLLLTCLCCKRTGVGFNFDNAEGEECSGASSPLPEDSLSSCPSLPEVYTLPLRERTNYSALPNGTDSKSQSVRRHALNYLQEIGNGWFGKVILAEVLGDCGSAQAVVKELRASASPLEQRKFLAESEPYRSLQHPNVLQCLGQCSEITPYLLVMEFCQLGDLKRYLRAQRKSDGMTPDLLSRDLLTLQRMAFEITSGLLHLHENNYIHSDLALRNCLLTSDLTVRIGDYGLSHNHYKEDYYLTPDKLWIPLRWIAPELLEEYRGSLIVTDQTKTSNVWSLGVVIWELFEFGSQPHRHLSDEEVLTFVIRERQITLAQPRLKLSHADYWYEVMQSCWLPSSQRPSIAEIFLLLSSLLAAERRVSRRSMGDDEDEEEYEEEDERGRRGESEDSFERRWDSLRPPAFQTVAGERRREREYEREYERDDNGYRGHNGSFPLLDPVGNSIAPSSSELDDILTVTETSKGLNFEYFWEKAHGRKGYKPLPPPQPIPTPNSTHRQSLDTPTVVPVISARSPSLASEYYIRLEEHTPQDRSPTLKGKVPSQRTESTSPGDLELVELQSGMLGKEEKGQGSVQTVQTVRSSEIQVLVPNTGVVEFSKESSNRVTDFTVVDIGERGSEREGRSRQSHGSQGPILPPKPRTVPPTAGNLLHSRPLPAPPVGYHRLIGLGHYPGTSYPLGKGHGGSCSVPKATFDHLGLHRHRQTMPPSPSLSPSIPQSSGGHSVYPPPQTCPPPLPPHYRIHRAPYYPGEPYTSRYSSLHLQRDPLSCDYLEKRPLDKGLTRSQSLYNSRGASEAQSRDIESPVHRDSPRSKMTRSQSTIPTIERHSSSSPNYSDEDDSPFESPTRLHGASTVQHTSLANERDSATDELLSRGMKRTQSRLATILPAIWREDEEMRERAEAARKSPMHLFLTEISSVSESTDSKTDDTTWSPDGQTRQEAKAERETIGNIHFPLRGMRRSQSLVTELGSAARTWDSDILTSTDYGKGSVKKDLFLTEINTERRDSEDLGEDSYENANLCPTGLPSYAEAEEAFSRGMRRSRSLLSEMSEQAENESSRKGEMTREEFLKEIQSAETFLTEIITRQRKQEEALASTPPTSPEYESICIDPEAGQTITFQSERPSTGTNNAPADMKEAIYAQVTKRAKRSEIKVAMRPDIPVLQIGSEKYAAKLERKSTSPGSSCLPSESGNEGAFGKDATSSHFPSNHETAIKPRSLELSGVSPRNGLFPDQCLPGAKEDSFSQNNFTETNTTQASEVLPPEENQEKTRAHDSSERTGEDVRDIDDVFSSRFPLSSPPEIMLTGNSTRVLEQFDAVEGNEEGSNAQTINTSTVIDIAASTENTVEHSKHCVNKTTFLDLSNDTSMADTEGCDAEMCTEIGQHISDHLSSPTCDPSYSTAKPYPVDSANDLSTVSPQKERDDVHTSNSVSPIPNRLPSALIPDCDQKLSSQQIRPADPCFLPLTSLHQTTANQQTHTDSTFISLTSTQQTPTDSSFSPLTSTQQTPTDSGFSPLTSTQQTPTDSAFSTLTSASSSTDCLTAGDLMMAGGLSSGWRALGAETPHRDSAYFSDSDWESGEGIARRVGDGLGLGRPGNSRGGERGTLVGIEEKMEIEYERGHEGTMHDEAVVIREEDKMETDEEKHHRWSEEMVFNKDNMIEKDLVTSECNDYGLKEIEEPINESKDTQGKANEEFIAKLFSNLDDETFKGFPYSCNSQLSYEAFSQMDKVEISNVQSKDNTCYDPSEANPLSVPPKTIPPFEPQSESHLQQLLDEEVREIQPDVNEVTSGSVLKELNSGSSQEGLLGPTSTNPDSSESRLSRFYNINTNDSNPSNNAQENFEDHMSDSKEHACRSLFSDRSGDEPTTEDIHTFEMQSDDANELGLRNLSYSEDVNEVKAMAKSECEKQLAAGELCFSMKEVSRGERDVPVTQNEPSGPAGTSEVNSNGEAKELELKTQELWNTLEEDEGTGGFVKGELDCHRFQQDNLHLWPAENDQWASAETRRPEAELGSEFFSSSCKKAWGEKNGLDMGREFWDAEANDELAESEPHPTARQKFEEDFNDERQGHTDHAEVEGRSLSVQTPISQDFTVSEGPHNLLQQADIEQEEENIEDLDQGNHVDLAGEAMEIEVENIENPGLDLPSSVKIRHTDSAEDSCTIVQKYPGFNSILGDSEAEENQNFNKLKENHVTDTVDGSEELCPQTPYSSESDFGAAGFEADTNRSHIPDSGHNSESLVEIQNHSACIEDAEDHACPPTKRKKTGDGVFEDVREESRSDSPSCPSLTNTADPCKMHSSNTQCLMSDLVSEDIINSVPPSLSQHDKCQSPTNFPNVVHHIEIKVSSDSELSVDSTSAGLGAKREQERTVSPTSEVPASVSPQAPPVVNTISKGISANISILPVQRPESTDLREEHNHKDPNSASEASLNNTASLSQKATHPQLALGSCGAIPELLISEWKDLEEEPLEDFERLEQLCRISEDCEDSLGDLFLGNLELLESLKKTPEQRLKSRSESNNEDARCSEAAKPSEEEDSGRLEMKKDVDCLSDTLRANSEEQGRYDGSNQTYSPESSWGKRLSPDINRKTLQTTSNHSPSHAGEGAKGQQSLSTMPTKNGLMMQVCEERLQYSLSENVQTNVLWGPATVSDSVVLRPWSDTAVTEQEEESNSTADKQTTKSKEKPEAVDASLLEKEAAEAPLEPLTVLEQPEMTPSPPAANQAMKAKLARLSLSLPPLALSLPLSPNPKVGFWEGGESRDRSGRRRGLPIGGDPDEDEEEEEQDDETPRRVIVVTETDVDKRVGLRSLLKSPREPVDKENRDRGRNVSFFDDVTVYLFDQETPTNELGSCSTPTSPSAPGKSHFDGFGTSKMSKSRDHSTKARSPTGSSRVTSSRFTVSPADDPHLV
ncbi:uncharacterized protein lmtk3 isoform X2 [Alosa sapidissima]|uniref:uncharacterized protein lmtk3 isoform X2 n=1 Tax=Alosa sapidissima TaxID=34773 RepID=UPI001C099AA6|nr:uncharacterized protein lmtk3 isoform X2 [Alosa sapidissima]